MSNAVYILKARSRGDCYAWRHSNREEEKKTGDA